MTKKNKKEKVTTPRNSLFRRVCARWQIYLLLILPVAYLIIFHYVPMGGLVLAFKDYSFRKGIWGSEWVGLDNFRRFFSSYKFKTILGNTLSLSVYSLLVSFPLPVIFALLLNAMRGKRYKKTI